MGIQDEQLMSMGPMLKQAGMDPATTLWSELQEKMGGMGGMGGSQPMAGPGANIASSSSQPSYREQLEALYEVHNPDKLDTIDALLKKYKGKERSLIRKVKKKYAKKKKKTDKEEL
eukprot:g3660.t1